LGTSLEFKSGTKVLTYAINVPTPLSSHKSWPAWSDGENDEYRPKWFELLRITKTLPLNLFSQFPSVIGLHFSA